MLDCSRSLALSSWSESLEWTRWPIPFAVVVCRHLEAGRGRLEADLVFTPPSKTKGQRSVDPNAHDSTKTTKQAGVEKHRIERRVGFICGNSIVVDVSKSRTVLQPLNLIYLLISLLQI